jgi:TonB family protein
LLVVVLSFLGCVASQKNETPVNPSESDYRSYLIKLRDKIQSVWKYPPGIAGTNTVKIRFVLDADGKLVSAEVVESTDPRVSSSALDAINRAAPFSPYPEILQKVVGEPLFMTFTVNVKLR